MKVPEARVVRGPGGSFCWAAQDDNVIERATFSTEIDAVFEIIFEWFLRLCLWGGKRQSLKHFLFNFKYYKEGLITFT